MSEEDSPQDAEEQTEEETEEQTEENNRKTVLYAMTREALRPEDLKSIKSALEDEDYFLVPSEDGDNVMIQREEDQGSSIDVSDVLAD